MAKRFHDTEIWAEDWFLALPDSYMLLWFWIKDKCDHAGIWKPNTTTFQKVTGKEVSLKKALELFNGDKGRIEVLSNSRWLIPDFIPFQYGNHLNIKNRVHFSILKILEVNGVKLTSIRGLIEVRQGVKDKDKDKDISTTKGGMGGIAQEVYSCYAKTIKPGAREDAIKNITKLLKIGISKEELLGRINAYRSQIVKEGTKPGFYIQANNFFGEKARYKDFEPVKPPSPPKPDPNCNICEGKGRILEGTQKGATCLCVK